MRKIITLGILVLLLLVGARAWVTRTPEVPPLTSLVGPFFDANYDVAPQFLAFQKESRFVRLSDGTDLAVDIFVPKDASRDNGSLATSFPTILEYTPYNRAIAQPGMSWWQRLFLRWRFGLKEPVYDRALLSTSARMMMSCWDMHGKQLKNNYKNTRSMISGFCYMIMPTTSLLPQQPPPLRSPHYTYKCA